MSELDDKLNALLSNPDSMAQVMQLAQQLSGTFGGDMPTPPPPPPPQQSQTPQSNSASLLGNLDPKLISRLLPLLQGQNNSQTMQLLYALRPFLKEEKQGKVERAAKLARLIYLGKQFLSEWEV
ncbi:MAG: hypothetical protein KBS74_06590 [Clostridiales bacterium]|nr:hypothetical protein [Candidatus Cacconaster stercorequi]